MLVSSIIATPLVWNMDVYEVVKDPCCFSDALDIIEPDDFIQQFDTWV